MAPAETDTYDVVVIGGGPVGENAADYAIRNSDRTAVIVEHQLVGGECSFWACMPSKALLGPGAALATARGLPGARERVTQASPDPAAVIGWRDTVTHGRDDTSQIEWARGAGIDVVRGHARIVGERTVEVGERRLTARHAVVVATGSVASIPPIDELREALPWTSRDATNVVEVPERVVILGGGVVACEAATWLLDLGVAELTMVVRGERLLPKAELFASAAIADALGERGARVRFGCQISAVQRPDAADTGYGRIHGGPCRVTLTDAAGEQELEVDEVLVAAGRSPATRDLGLDRLGIEAGKPLRVDDHLTVPDHPWLYAVGDANGRVSLTHMGKYQARVAGEVIAARADGRSLEAPRLSASADHDAIPQVVFTRPQLASVGRTEAQARADGVEVQTVEADIAVAGSYLHGPDDTGHANLVIDRARGVVVGATFVGPDIAELVHAATIAVVGEVPVDRLWHAVPAYPTVSEVWLRLLEAVAP
ncbi:NAD(P)/FAD-dependent oxidoreductase [Gordonia sp. CPCC 205515]|uniref:dihydrolipoyl dehydrogenase family protein n=1 Tax=Gordonia sp. CPCC 205515 TaxID=3140791 RepID=UPI003AF36871